MLVHKKIEDSIRYFVHFSIYICLFDVLGVTAAQPAETEPPQSTALSRGYTKVLCVVFGKSYLDQNNVTFDVGKVDWNLCTHVVSVAVSDEGINRRNYESLRC